jgi:hypothetical protein
MPSNKLINKPDITVTLPDGQNIHSVAATQLQIPITPQTATIAHFFPDLKPHSLLPVGQLCDVGCVATFDCNQVTINYRDTPILRGERNKTTRLWSVPVQITTQPPKVPIATPSHHSTHIVNHVLRTGELVSFGHAANFSPTLTTQQHAIRNNHLVGFPGLTWQPYEISQQPPWPRLRAISIKIGNTNNRATNPYKLSHTYHIPHQCPPSHPWHQVWNQTTISTTTTTRPHKTSPPSSVLQPSYRSKKWSSLLRPDRSIPNSL